MMRIHFPYTVLIFVSALSLTCSGSQLVTTGPEATCGRDRIESNANEKFRSANAQWSGGDAWKALDKIKEKIDDEEEKGSVDPELYYRRSDWGMRLGAKATARRDVKSLLKQGPNDLGLLASARYNSWYNKYADALKDVEERRALLCQGKGPECMAGCNLQRGFLLRRLGRKAEATRVFEQCRTEHLKASAQCGKFGNALNEYFLGNFDAAGRHLSELTGDWQGTTEARALNMLIENEGKMSRGQVRALRIRGFNTANSLEELLVFPFYP